MHLVTTPISSPDDHRLFDGQEPVISRPILFLPLALLAALTAVSWASFHSLHERLALSSSLPSSEPSGDPQARVRLDDVTGSTTLWAAYTPEVLAWAPSILSWSEIYQLDPNLIALVMQLESCGNPGIRSPAGAIGLFQVMPFHFTADEDPYDPETNAKRGLSYLARALTQASNQPHLALAGYNGGMTVMSSDPSQWPKETQRYVRWAQGILEEIAAGMSSSPTLLAWLEAGGAQLCRLASQSEAVTMSN